ncbi:MAG: 4Fe-4S binding protein [Desulfovibrio sp.]|jgi:NAD-dependent dihydropyrimidine dehydrogenase PreA subunit|nr:4Fe-4S binding protein [Desulfovibrio sp.]
MTAGRYALHLDFEACKACGYCLLVCPRKVYAPGTAFNKRGFRPFRVTAAEACIGCLRCFHVCPDFCLEVAMAGEGTNP